MFTSKIKYFAFIFLTYLFHGCTASFSNLESPKVLKSGEVKSQIGTSFLESPTPVNDVGLDVGIIWGIEADAKTDFQSGTISMRYQLLDTPFVAIGLGLLNIEDKVVYSGNQSDPSGNVWLPSILVGQDHWYLGAKLAYSTFDGNIADIDPPIIFEREKWNSITLIGGAIITIEKVNLLFEIDEYISRLGKPVLIPGIGVSKVL